MLSTIGRYKIERVLGKGAMGVVYEGVDMRVGRRVAIKTILKSQLGADAAREYSARFVREAQAAARLDHPNVERLLDFGEEGDIVYVVVEFINGRELKSYFDKKERFDMNEVVRIMGELCDALDYAHEAGIVHGALKPDNVMLDEQMRVKLTGFGVPRIPELGPESTQAGTLVGTPAFMSPEQIIGKPVDARSDVFCAGVVLYQFLTGEMPFPGSGAWTMAKKILQEDPPEPSSLNNVITPLFDAVADKALCKDPMWRFQSARDLGFALKRALEGRPEWDDEAVIGAAFTPRRPVPAAAPSTRPPAERTQVGAGPTQPGASQELELEFWRAIKDSGDPDDFELYLQQFPAGMFVALAQKKRSQLRGQLPEQQDAASYLLDSDEEELIGMAAPGVAPTTIPATPADDVHFTVTAPMSVAPGKGFLLDVWAHLESKRSEVLAIAAEAAAGGDVRSKTRGAVPVSRGETLVITVAIKDFGFEDTDKLVWNGSTGNASFSVDVPAQAGRGTYIGLVRFFLAGMQVSRLHFEIAVGEGNAVKTTCKAQEKRPTSVFASYASDDRNEVLARIQGMQKLLPDLDVFLDVASIRSGEKWLERLEAEIARRDAFFLFWSSAASRSTFVEQEWRTALRLKGADSIDPVPLEAPDEAPPPKELAHLHFNEWTLAYRRRQSRGDA